MSFFWGVIFSLDYFFLYKGGRSSKPIGKTNDQHGKFGKLRHTEMGIQEKSEIIESIWTCLAFKFEICFTAFENLSKLNE